MASAIIVFSHLRWDFVYRRPQHLLSRLAAHYAIVFVEPPQRRDGRAGFQMCSPAPNILVCQPLAPVDCDGFHDEHLPHLQEPLRELLHAYDEHIAWFYTPLALPLLQALRPQMVVYDCVDATAAGASAFAQLLQKESALLKAADIVLAGGPGLYRARRERHANVYCVPDSVDAAHFLPALDRANSHPAHRHIPGPRLGFYGVIDERFDADLVAQLADAHAQWQIVLVGPVTGIDPAALPQRANIHYLGEQPYEALPQFLAGWDVCLLPYKVNDATRFASPPGVLEYMAAELPIVGTPVADVADAYRDIVAVAHDAHGIVAACEAALLASKEELAVRVEKMRKVVSGTSWDAAAAQVREALERELARRDVVVEDDEEEGVAQEVMRYAKSAVVGGELPGVMPRV